MPISRIKTDGIQDDAITSAKIGDTNIAAADIADQAVTLAKLEHGTSSNNGKFLRANNGADPSYETVNTDLVADTTPQLGGALDAQTNNITNVGNLGIGTNSPQRQAMISRSIAGGSGELGIVSSDSSTTGALGNIHFGNSVDSSLASIRATADGATDAGKLEFNTEKTGAAIETAMRIDSNGRILKPLNVSFQARGANNNYITTSPIPFPTVTGNGCHNIGSHFDNTANTFTAPIAGRYFFHLHLGLVRNSAAGGNSYPYFRINGSAAQYSYFQSSPSGNNYANCNMSGIFSLAANDVFSITFSNTSGTYYNGDKECCFSGYLMG